MKTRLSKLGKDTLERKFAELHKIDKEIQKLDAHLKKKGFKPMKEKKHFWGIKGTYEDKSKTATFTIKVQDYSRPKSRDGAALGQICLSAGDRIEVYSFDLIAPDGNAKKAKEYWVDKELKVQTAESWWSCVAGEIEKTAPSGGVFLVQCASGALIGGPFSWAVFLACLAASIGTAFALVCACCGCNCQWWCWWLGCCRQ